MTVLDTPKARAPVTTADHQAADAAAGEECSDSEDRYVEIGQCWLAKKDETEPNHGQNCDFMVVVDDAFFSDNEFRGRGQNKERGNSCPYHNSKHRKQKMG